MDKQQLLERFHKELRENAKIQGFTREQTPFVIRHVSQFGEPGFIGTSSVNAENAITAIKHELQYFKERGQTFEWKLYDYDKPDNLMELLQNEGFTIGGKEALMVMELHDGHPLLQRSDIQDVREITDEQGIRQIVQLIETIWHDDFTELGERLLRDKERNPQKLYMYGIYEEEQLVSAAWMYFEADSSFASLWGGATLEPYRQKGYYTKLLAVRAQKAFAAGYPYLTVDASPMSRPILEKCGFHCLAHTYECQSPTT